jgi:hypothetical protein
MVTLGRLELPAYSLGNCRSILLSYRVAGPIHTPWNLKGQDRGLAALGEPHDGCLQSGLIILKL